MKKLTLLLPLFLLSSLSGCSKDTGPTLLTYGTYKDEKGVQLTSAEFTTRFNANENFLLAIYPKDSSCQCWNTFSYIINDVVKNEHLLIYQFYAQDVASNTEMKELGGFYDDLNAPSFYIIKEKKIAKSYRYSNNAPFFKTKEKFLEEVDAKVKRPKMYQISSEQLDAKIAAQESFSVFYARNKCSDCNYVTPNFLIPYFTSNYEKNNLYVFDIQDYYPSDKDAPDYEEKKQAYQDLKDKYLLSEKNNPTLGFGNGVVPSFQYYEAGVFKDMSVYVNDGALTYSDSDGCYYATGSYYNEARINNLHYLDNVEIKDLTKVRINENEVEKYENVSLWDISSSSHYHNLILKGFLDKYL